MQLYTILSFYKLDFFIPVFHFLEQQSPTFVAWRPGKEERETGLNKRQASEHARSSTYTSSSPVGMHMCSQLNLYKLSCTCVGTHAGLLFVDVKVHMCACRPAACIAGCQ